MGDPASSQDNSLQQPAPPGQHAAQQQGREQPHAVAHGALEGTAAAPEVSEAAGHPEGGHDEPDPAAAAESDSCYLTHRAGPLRR